LPLLAFWLLMSILMELAIWDYQAGTKVGSDLKSPFGLLRTVEEHRSL